MLEFKVKRYDFQRELGLVQSVVERRHTIPILANILVEAQDDAVKISGTDLDVSLRTAVSAEVIQPGSTTVQARKLFDIIRTLPEDPVHFQGEENRLVFSCGRSRFRLSTLPVENFPEIPTARGEPLLVVASRALKPMVERTAFATTQEESRYALSGVQMELKETDGEKVMLRMVATDGHRLALCEKVIAQPQAARRREPTTCLIPRKTMTELARLLGDRGDEEEVRFNKDENHVYFTAGERELVSRVLTGQFPNYEMVVPKEQPYSAAVNVELFTSALRRVALIADERSRGVKLAFSQGRVELSTRRVDEDEEARDDLMCEYNGEPLEISFNSSYVLDFFDVVKSGEVKIGLKDGQSPTLLSPTEDDYSYRYVVMPMRMV